MSTAILTAAAVDETAAPPLEDAEPLQYSRRKVLGVWAAAAVPMGILAWIVAPWLRDRIGGRGPFIEALLICFSVGLLWELALTLILVRRETARLGWSATQDALRLHAPRDTRTGDSGRKVVKWVLAFTLLSVAVNMLPIYGPVPRDLPKLLDT